MSVPSPSRSLMDQWLRMGGIAGVVFVVMFIVGLVGLQNGSPMPDDSAAEIKQYFSDNAHRYIWGDFVIGIGVILFFLHFASALCGFLGRAEGEGMVRSRLFFGNALIFAGTGAAAASLQGALAYNAGNFTDDNLLKTLVAATYYTNSIIFGVVVAGMVLPAALVILRTKVLWAWLGWLGLVEVPLSLLGALSVLGSDPMGGLAIFSIISILVLAVWIVAASVGMWRAEPTT